MQTETAATRTSGWRGAVGYLGVGVLSLLVDLVGLVVLREVVGLPVGLAAALSYLASVVVNFGLNRALVVGSDAAGLGGHAVRYAVLLGVNLVITVLVVRGAEEVDVPYLVAKVAVVAAATCWNFVLYRRWVFAAR